MSVVYRLLARHVGCYQQLSVIVNIYIRRMDLDYVVVMMVNRELLNTNDHIC